MIEQRGDGGDRDIRLLDEFDGGHRVGKQRAALGPGARIGGVEAEDGLDELEGAMGELGALLAAKPIARQGGDDAVHGDFAVGYFDE